MSGSGIWDLGSRIPDPKSEMANFRVVHHANFSVLFFIDFGFFHITFLIDSSSVDDV